MKLTFGKFKGKELSKVPVSYLCMAIEEDYFRHCKQRDQFRAEALECIRKHYDFPCPKKHLKLLLAKLRIDDMEKRLEEYGKLLSKYTTKS